MLVYLGWYFYLPLRYLVFSAIFGDVIYQLRWWFLLYYVVIVSVVLVFVFTDQDVVVVYVVLCGGGFCVISHVGYEGLIVILVNIYQWENVVILWSIVIMVNIYQSWCVGFLWYYEVEIVTVTLVNIYQWENVVVSWSIIIMVNIYQSRVLVSVVLCGVGLVRVMMVVSVYGIHVV